MQTPNETETVGTTSSVPVPERGRCSFTAHPEEGTLFSCCDVYHSGNPCWRCKYCQSARIIYCVPCTRNYDRASSREKATRARANADAARERRRAATAGETH